MIIVYIVGAIIFIGLLSACIERWHDWFIGETVAGMYWKQYKAYKRILKEDQWLNGAGDPPWWRRQHKFQKQYPHITITWSH